MSDEALAALHADARRSDVLLDLAEFAERAARAAHARDACADGRTRSILADVVLALLQTAGRLVMLSWRVWQGRGFPRPRGCRPPAAQEASGPAPAARPRLRSAWQEARFADLAALGVPEAEAMRAELAALLADPQTAEMVAAEPAVWRAAASLARAFGLKPPPRPAAAEPEPEPEPDDGPDVRAAPPVPQAPPPAHPEARRHPLRPDGGADPPSGGR